LFNLLEDGPRGGGAMVVNLKYSDFPGPGSSYNK
jgi:hypothetical protein